jgi:hypothetical protein|tara:strand:- start:34 stop:495 length:462 start_codon:yes stop_codon:yes gene_type:complete
MATINATITVASDLTSSPLSLSKTMTMRKAASCNGLELTSGLVQRKFTSANQVNLVATGAQNYGTPTATTNANKIYIKNTGSSTTNYLLIGLGDAGGGSYTTDAVNGDAMTIGRLYGGDWMLIPAHLATDVGDIWIAPNSAEEATAEYMLFFE